jgi:hypothetical protein
VFIHFVKLNLWLNPVTFWCLVFAGVVSLIGGALLMGLGGVVPFALTSFTFQPSSAWRFVSDALSANTDRSLTGDQVWPFMLVSGLLWPWWFPISSLLVHQFTRVRWESLALGFTFALAGIVLQTVVLSYLFFSANVFLPR